MKESGYYPEGAEFDPRAPWNEKEITKEEIDVDLTLILKKKVKIKVDKDKLECNDDNFKNEILDQVIMPQQAYKYIVKDIEERKKVFSSLCGWKLDDLEYDKTGK